MDAVAATYRLVDAFAAELRRCDVRHVCLCPGSRSTPLALAFARSGAGGGASFNLWVHLDERSAAYFALGLAKAAREPVVLVCTSGTAAANFLPAVIEANQAHVPLLICTADRPPELHGIGANQTILQAGLYGPHVRLAIDLPVPDADPAVARFAVVAAQRAVTAARGAPAGPVHLNFPFREPLVPAGPLPAPPPAGAARATPVSDGSALTLGRAAPPANLAAVLPPPRPTSRQAAPADVEALANVLGSARRGLIVCGEQADLAFPFAVATLARLLRFPVLADPLSGVRSGPHHSPLILDSYDALLRDAAFAASVEPDCILRFGAAPTSKPLLQYLEAKAGCPQVLIGEEGWLDPTLSATCQLAADPTLACAALAALLEDHEPARATLAWAERWQASATAARTALDEGVKASTAPFEGRVFTELARLLPAGALLFAGNSMPVRDLDTFFPGGERPIHCLANRGASGIDGVVSSAFGAAAADLGPVVLVIGDLSFYHDMNGLLAAKRFGLNLTIVLVNNDGGGIFSFLPQAAQAHHFERLFGTPHGLDFAPAAALYGARYARPQTWRDFASAVDDGLGAGGLSIVEVRTERAANVRQHRELWAHVSAALAANRAAAGVGGDAR